MPMQVRWGIDVTTDIKVLSLVARIGRWRSRGNVLVDLRHRVACPVEGFGVHVDDDQGVVLTRLVGGDGRQVVVRDIEQRVDGVAFGNGLVVAGRLEAAITTAASSVGSCTLNKTSPSHSCQPTRSRLPSRPRGDQRRTRSVPGPGTPR